MTAFLFFLRLMQNIASAVFLYVNLKEKRWKPSTIIFVLIVEIVIVQLCEYAPVLNNSTLNSLLFIPVNTVILFLLDMAFVFFVSKDKPSRTLFVFSLKWTILLVSQTLAVASFFTLTAGAPAQKLLTSWNCALLVCSLFHFIIQMVLTCIISIFLSIKASKRRCVEFVPTLVLIFVQLLLFYTSAVRQHGKFTLSFVIFLFIESFFCIFLDIYLIVIAPPKTTENKVLKEKLACLQEVRAGEKMFFSTLLEKERDMAMLRHDWNNILQVAMATLEQAPASNQSNESKTLLNSLANRVSNTTATRYSKNELVNALLNAKVKILNDNAIPYTVCCSLPEKTKMDPMDLCRLLSNLIDNATEHCLANPSPKNFINIFVKAPSTENFMIQVENYAQLSGKNLPKTTKANKKLHGYGTDIVRDTAEKYDGAFNFTYSDNKATATVFLIDG